MKTLIRTAWLKYRIYRTEAHFDLIHKINVQTQKDAELTKQIAHDGMVELSRKLRKLRAELIKLRMR